jgi:predicted nucleotidyltransferase
MDKIFIATNSQKILNFLAQSPNREYLSSEIQKATGVSKAGTNLALRNLAKAKLIKREKRGKFYLYSADLSSPVIKQMKVLKTVLSLSSLINKLKKCAHKIILYGSRSRGEDTEDSDIDLFVVTNMLEEVERIVKKQAIGKRVRLTMRTPLKYTEMETTDPIFYNEVERGIILWESKDEP